MNLISDWVDLLRAGSSEWIQVKDKDSNWTIEDFPYETGVDEKITSPHCWKCVTVNKCIFKNEIHKKPERFHYNFDIIGELLKKFGLDLQLGIYHPMCHCKELAINLPGEKDILVSVDNGKINDFFNRKIGLSKSWGYGVSNKTTFLNNFIKGVLTNYSKGHYQIFKHDKYGVQITIFTEIIGINEKKGRKYKFKTGFTVFTNGKLKNNTIFGGKIK